MSAINKWRFEEDKKGIKEFLFKEIYTNHVLNTYWFKYFNELTYQFKY